MSLSREFRFYAENVFSRVERFRSFFALLFYGAHTIGNVSALQFVVLLALFFLRILFRE